MDKKVYISVGMLLAFGTGLYYVFLQHPAPDDILSANKLHRLAAVRATTSARPAPSPAADDGPAASVADRRTPAGDTLTDQRTEAGDTAGRHEKATVDDIRTADEATVDDIRSAEKMWSRWVTENDFVTIGGIYDTCGE